MAPHTPQTLGAPRRSRGTPRSPDTLLEREDADATRVERPSLKRDEPADAGGGQRQQLVEARAAEGRLLRGALDLDELAGARHDDVHVDGGAGVLDIVQVEHGHAADDADADGGHAVAHRRTRA